LVEVEVCEVRGGTMTNATNTEAAAQSAPVHSETVQQMADRSGVCRRLMFQAAALHRYGCPEIIEAARTGALSIKNCEWLAKNAPHDVQRFFLKETMGMSCRQSGDIVALLKGDLIYQSRQLRAA
jgi:hypothetical protein